MTKENKNFLTAAVLLALSAVTVRFAVGILYFNSFDTYWYRGWAFSLSNGLFDVYARAEEISLDYPPVYLFCLYLTGLAYRIFGNDCAPAMQMFLMKFWPILFDGLCVLWIYKVSRRYGEWMALFAAFLWAFNPSVFFGTAYWGQTDQLMALLLLIAFYLANENRSVLACIAFAIAGMTKYQCLFFTPVILLFIFKKDGMKQLLYGIFAAAGIVATVFLPFMIGARDPFLFFRVYLGGAGTYKLCTFNGYNIYTLLGLNAVSDGTEIIGALSGAELNIIFVLLILAAVTFMFLAGKRRNIYVGALFIMDALFVFATRMHERYLVAAIPFALMAYITTRRRDFLIHFAALTVTTLANQAAVLLPINNRDIFFASAVTEISLVIAVLNILLFCYITYTCAKYFFGREKENDLFQAKT